LRNALARLENGIRDVSAAEIRAIILRELGPKLDTFDVRMCSTILSEASVSAVVRFTWRDPVTHSRQQGVFKVLKPHIPEYFAEDMDYLQGLAQYFGDRHHTYGFPRQLIPDTFRKVRRLLRHEVNFRREQSTLLEAAKLYRNQPRVRVPQLIQPLCTSHITAMSHERGIKITNAASRLPAAHRRHMAEQLIEALVAFPLLSSQHDVIFHGDPHAGNLLYDRRNGKLVVLDWALRERLNRDQRRHLALMFAMLGLRDPVGTTNEIVALAQYRIPRGSPRAQLILDTVTAFFDDLPLAQFPNMVDAMMLLERIATKNVRFPGPLIMLSKVMFTLDGILRDVAGTDTGMSFTIARHLAHNWLWDRKSYRSPILARDWITLQCSAALYTTRLWIRCEKSMLNRVLPPHPQAAATSA
jgi:ubiquinone biosynthesis protein